MSLIKKYADGGMPYSMAEPWFERKAPISAYAPTSGFYNTAGPGRTDNIGNLVPSGAYILPADVVSGLGEGNSLAGKSVIDKMFHSEPQGIEAPKLTHGRGVGIPSAPREFSEKNGFAKGGTAKHVPIITAGGEYMLTPEVIIKKFGSLDRGHKILDSWVLHMRKKNIKDLKGLKGPVK